MVARNEIVLAATAVVKAERIVEMTDVVWADTVKYTRTLEVVKEVMDVCCTAVEATPRASEMSISKACFTELLALVAHERGTDTSTYKLAWAPYSSHVVGTVT